MENIKPGLYFPYREEDVRLKEDPTAASKALLQYLLQCKAHMLFTMTEKAFSWFHTHDVNEHFSAHEEPPGVFVPGAG